MTTPSSIHRLLTILVGFGGTAAGVLGLFVLQPAIMPGLLGGEALCRGSDCGLGVGVWLIFGGFVVAFASLIAAVVVTIRQGHEARALPAARQGLLACLWCLPAYVAESVVLWIVV